MTSGCGVDSDTQHDGAAAHRCESTSAGISPMLYVGLNPTIASRCNSGQPPVKLFGKINDT